MTASPCAFAGLAALMAATAWAAEDSPAASGLAPDVAKPWAFAVTAYPTVVRGGQNYTSGIATADRGPLHLEARINYESIGARSAFVGWTFSGGDTVTWELTPLLGGAWGTTQAFVPGLEVTLGWKQFDFYVEAEYVRSRSNQAEDYVYAWSELGWRPIEWLRFGLAGQRTNIYGGERSFQRGPFAQVTWGPVTLGGYWFNPGSSAQIFVGSIGVAF